MVGPGAARLPCRCPQRHSRGDIVVDGQQAPSAGHRRRIACAAGKPGVPSSAHASGPPDAGFLRTQIRQTLNVARPPSGPMDERRSEEPGEASVATGRSSLRSLVDWFFRDRRTGKILIVHVPNLAIVLWMATVLARQLTIQGTTAHALLEWAGTLTLGWWAIDEVVRGVNPWRRVLGLAGCLVVVLGVVTRLQS